MHPFYAARAQLFFGRRAFAGLGLLSIKRRNLNYFWSTSDSIHGCCWFRPALLGNQPRESKNTGSHVEIDINLVFPMHNSAVMFMVNFWLSALALCISLVASSLGQNLTQPAISSLTLCSFQTPVITICDDSSNDPLWAVNPVVCHEFAVVVEFLLFLSLRMPDP